MERARVIRFDFLHDPRPALVERVASVRLPPEVYVQTIVAGIAAVAIAVTAGVENLRLHAARSSEWQVRQHFEETRHALDAVRLQWQQLDALATRDRRLRDIRLSGSHVAVRIADVGNAFPRRASATTLTVSPSGYALKARGVDLPAASAVLGNLLGDRELAADASFRMTREDGFGAGTLAFEIRAGTTR